jgi:hypothetical protein
MEAGGKRGYTYNNAGCSENFSARADESEGEFRLRTIFRFLSYPSLWSGLQKPLVGVVNNQDNIFQYGGLVLNIGEHPGLDTQLNSAGNYCRDDLVHRWSALLKVIWRRKLTWLQNIGRGGIFM